VADDEARAPGPFDVQTIKQLVALMSRHDLSEIDLRDGSSRLRLRRGARRAAAPDHAAVPAPAAPPAVAPPPAQEQAKPAKALQEIKSPTPGTFYSAASPGADPFVRKGSRVTPSTVVGLVEAMKLFNEIQAECSGVIAEILVENQQPVEYGQVLFRVDPTA
jgi:acetyl-CoA carboxylase biotin carboxyl carrier protein